ncbi:hypothetical protein GCM10023195_30580 [Actinoallomurus liliacearum]|uniref:Secreted protein n=1 Tax=Actinoallomurus liliacearum TaxID=1080073 RepID=A0ABP8TK59_9ACTN
MNRVRAGMAAIAGAAMVGAGLLLPAGPASAKVVTVTGDLLDTCPNSGVTVPYTADRCVFVPESQESFQSDFHVPTNDEYAWNCTTAAQDHQYQITDTVEESNSFGISGGPKLTLIKDVLEVGVEASYGHVWNKGQWIWNGDTHHIQPGNVGWLELSTEMLKVNGHWQINYGDRVKTSDNGEAHYEWYVGGSVTDDKDAGSHNVAFRERPMTDEEKSRVCGNNGQGPGEGGPQLKALAQLVVTQDAAGNVPR